MRYVSLFSGIEAASVAWEQLGWEPVAFSEIERFPCELLAKRFPHVPNLGDITQIDWSKVDGPVDIAIGGSPCQSFSVAGLRKGLMDPRGNLMLEYLRAVDALRPRWVVWENVPGVLSSDGGRDFATLLRGLEELGYGFAYRVLDAQYFGVPQRRRRVFVVGCAGGQWQRAAAVLFERGSLQGHTPPRRQKGEGAAEGAGGGAAYSIAGNVIGRDPKNGGNHLGVDEDVSHTLTTADRHAVLAFSAGQSSRAGSIGAAVDIAPTLRGGASGTNQVPSVLAFAQNQRDEVRILGGDGQVAGALAAEAGMKQQTYLCMADDNGKAAVDEDMGGTPKAGGVPPIVMAPSFSKRPGQQIATSDAGLSYAITTGQPPSVLHGGGKVRRLMPVECERLQGFPDGWTQLGDTKDAPRYKALGNSMAVPVIRWIGERIQEVDAI